jgi:predicted RNase H-like nuclease (RuvC/YqgF family)
MITNKDVPQDPEGVESSRTAQPPAQRAYGNSPYANPSSGSQSYRNQASANQPMADQRAGEQWRERIEEQKNRVSTLQARIDHINEQIRARGGTVQYDQPYSRYAAQAQERVAEMQQQLNEQQHRLEMMQEAARRAGMHTSIYDP